MKYAVLLLLIALPALRPALRPEPAPISSRDTLIRDTVIGLPVMISPRMTWDLGINPRMACDTIPRYQTTVMRLGAAARDSLCYQWREGDTWRLVGRVSDTVIVLGGAARDSIYLFGELDSCQYSWMNSNPNRYTWCHTAAQICAMVEKWKKIDSSVLRPPSSYRWKWNRVRWFPACNETFEIGYER